MHNKLTDAIEALDLKFGQTHRGKCPSCSKSNTFTATFTDEGIVYNCYSLGCKATGLVSSDMDVDTIQRRLMERKMGSIKSNVNTGSVIPMGHDFEVPDRVVPVQMNHGPNETPHLWSRTQQFLKYWDIMPSHEMFYDIKDDRVVFPVYGSGRYASTILDMVGRSLDKTVSPKWLRYGATDQPYVSQPCNMNVCVIVEDVISAIKVLEECDIPGVALLGTQLTQAHKEYLSRNYDGCIIALDRDALSKQMDMARELSSVMASVKVCRLQDDIKYGLRDDVDEINRLRVLATNELKETM